jgi:hypothetical protein
MTRLATRPARLPAVVALALGVTLGAAPASAQAARDGDGPYRHDVVDSTAVVAALALHIGSGTADDPDRQGGLTHLTVDALRRALLEMPGVVEVEAVAERSETRVTVVVRPDEFAAVEARLAEPRSLGPGIPGARAAARERFSFTAATPRDEMELEAARLLTGLDDPWSRSIRGSPSSLGVIDDAAIYGRWAALLEAPAARVRIGPPGAFPAPTPPPKADSARAAAPTGAVNPGVAVDPAGAEPAPAPSVAPAWIDTDRVRIVRDVTNMWIVVGFPLPPDLERTSVDHLVHRIDEILHPVPGDAGLIGAEVEVVRLPEGEAIVVTASVLPPSAARWEARIVGIPERITPPFDPDFFRWERRRFRAHLLLRDAPVGARAARVAADLMAGGRVRDLAAEAWELEPDDLANAAGRLGPPRILVFGPDVSDRL